MLTFKPNPAISSDYEVMDDMSIPEDFFHHFLIPLYSHAKGASYSGVD